jgi:hypothetical protein
VAINNQRLKNSRPNSIPKWFGKIEDINDPSNQGRARVRIFGKFDNIPTNSLPWAMRKNDLSFSRTGGSGNFSTPTVGTVVSVYFDSDDPYTPIYDYIPKLNPKLVEKIKDDYEGAHSWVYDVDDSDKGLKIYHLNQEGLVLDLNGVKIRITPDGEIHLGKGETASLMEYILKGETFQKTFNNHTHIGNLGAPTSPPQFPSPPTDLSKITKSE